MVRVKGSPKAGSFEIDLILDWICEHPADAVPIASFAGISSVVCTVKAVIRLAKWAKGKTLSILGQDADQCKVRNIDGEEISVSITIVNIYNNRSTHRDLDKLPMSPGGRHPAK